jgi:hypothetical protein
VTHLEALANPDHYDGQSFERPIAGLKFAIDGRAILNFR